MPAQHNFEGSLQHIVKLLPLVAVGLLLSARRILAHGYDEGLGQLVTEVVGQMMVFVLLAAVELEPLARR